MRHALVLVAILLLAPASGALPPASGVTLERVASGLVSPVLVTHADDGSGRTFIVEQPGRVRLMGSGAVYLDIASKVLCCGERGLLGLAFAPDFEDSGRLYVSYSRKSDGAATLERLTVANPAVGTPPANGQVLLTVPDLFPNHNGGHVAFGPDGYLYWAVGDGGGAGDPLGTAQDTSVLQGKLMRLDVSGSGYTIPPDNPFANGGGRAEIWAYGLRNPWRYSFDRASGDLWIADVGQNLVEEVNLQRAGTPGGQNYGWDAFEGHLVFAPGGATPDPRGKTFPVIEYLHQPHCSVTGGYVARGPDAGALAGAYVYGDFCSGFVWAAREGPGGLWQSQLVVDSPYFISSFGEDEAGSLYLVHYSGAVYKVRGA